LLFVIIADGAAAQKAARRSCVVLQPLAGNAPPRQFGECGVRLSPASTYKIPHALIALETGAVTLDSVEKWDGTRHARQAEWNRDHTVISALRPSVLWLFQRIAPRIGAERATAWLDTFEYGNRKVSGPITQYWVDGSLAISPLEQAGFLRRFYQGTLPVQRRYIDAVREGLEQRPGTVENALGVHQLDGDWSHARLSSKTGATTTADYRVSWLVGMLTVNGGDYVFASAVWQRGGDIDTLEGARRAARAFIEEGMIRRRD
jgi:beta-lactamase class D